MVIILHNKKTTNKEYNLNLITLRDKILALTGVTVYVVLVAGVLIGLFAASYFLFINVEKLNSGAVLISSCMTLIFSTFLGVVEVKLNTLQKLYNKIIRMRVRRKLKRCHIQPDDATFLTVNGLSDKILSSNNFCLKFSLPTGNSLETVALLYEQLIHLDDLQKVFEHHNKIVEVKFDQAGFSIDWFCDRYKRCYFISNVVLCTGTANLSVHARSKVANIIFATENNSLSKGIIIANNDSSLFANFVKLYKNDKNDFTRILLLAAAIQSDKGYFTLPVLYKNLKKCNIPFFRSVRILIKNDVFVKMPFRITNEPTYIINAEKDVNNFHLQSRSKRHRFIEEEYLNIIKNQIENIPTSFFEFHLIIDNNYGKAEHESFVKALSTNNYEVIERILNSHKFADNLYYLCDCICLYERMGKRNLCSQYIQNYVNLCGKSNIYETKNCHPDTFWQVIFTHIENRHCEERERILNFLNANANDSDDYKNLVLEYWKLHIRHETGCFDIDALRALLNQFSTMLQSQSEGGTSENIFYIRHYIRRLCSDLMRTAYVVWDGTLQSVVSCLDYVKCIEKVLPEAQIYSLRYEYGDLISFILLFATQIESNAEFGQFARKYLAIETVTDKSLTDAALKYYALCQERFILENNKGDRTTDPRICDIEMASGDFVYDNIRRRIENFIATSTDAEEVFLSYGYGLLCKLNLLETVREFERMTYSEIPASMGIIFREYKSYFSAAKEALTFVKEPSLYTKTRFAVLAAAAGKVAEFTGIEAADINFEDFSLDNEYAGYREKTAFKKIVNAKNLDEVKHILKFYNLILL